MLFDIVRHKQALVADVLTIVPLNKRTAWLNLVERLMKVSLSIEPYIF